jgi:hypothetical protein
MSIFTILGSIFRSNMECQFQICKGGILIDNIQNKYPIAIKIFATRFKNALNISFLT